ncbi:hypothetical protein ACFKEU_001892, partial [Streptococcus pyogenes]
KIYNCDTNFWNYVMKYWIDDTNNQDEVLKFFDNLKIAFHKTAPFYNINPTSSWPFITGQL